MDHSTRKILAYYFGRRKNEALIALKSKLSSFNIRYYYTDDWGSYHCVLPEDSHFIGKKNTQAIECKHVTLRIRIKRLVRKTICFSKCEKMHDVVIGLFINKFELGKAI
ncbi:IS1 family transposase [Piscirickettsia salmonis]|uniref:IS1 family transposase n=1 Tax=Piscirickettsia salmonis TaxID=1238 RepID=UPI003A7F7422